MITRAIAHLISGLIGDRNTPVTVKQMRVLEDFLRENYGDKVWSYFKSSFDWDDERSAWFWHTNPEEALLDAIMS